MFWLPRCFLHQNGACFDSGSFFCTKMVHILIPTDIFAPKWCKEFFLVQPIRRVEIAALFLLAKTLLTVFFVYFTRPLAPAHRGRGGIDELPLDGFFIVR